MGGVRASQRTAVSFHKASFLKFVNYFIYVFIWLPQPSVVAHRICFLLRGTDSLVAAHRLQSSQASVVAACRCSCFTVCGILVPRPRIKPESSAWKADSSPLDHEGSPQLFFFNRAVIHMPSLGPSLPSEFHVWAQNPNSRLHLSRSVVLKLG